MLRVTASVKEGRNGCHILGSGIDPTMLLGTCNANVLQILVEGDAVAHYVRTAGVLNNFPYSLMQI